MGVQLSKQQIEQYFELGYLVVEGVLRTDKLTRLRQETEAIIARASEIAEHNEIYDLEDSHSAQNPRVRRIKEPHKHFPYFGDLFADSDITDVLVPLLGENIRIYGAKMNMKAAGYGAPVEWHQDWAFYPHTNDDVLATGILLDDCEESNGPLLVVPGSHKGPVYDHHDPDGYFCGAFNPHDQSYDVSQAHMLTGPAGSMSIHHVRAVHGSAMNTSDRPRRLLLTEYAAADAFPLVSRKGSFEDYEARMVRGVSTKTPRLEPVPVRLPLPAARHQGSIYENQKATKQRFFQTFEDRAAE